MAWLDGGAPIARSTRVAGECTSSAGLAGPRGWPAVALAGLVATLLVAFFPLLADDAYIVARYAEQVHRGLGLVFNPGERIDALTSPLHAALLIALRLAFADVVTAYRVVAAAAAVACLVVTARRSFAQPGPRMAFLAATLGSPFVAFWLVGGLETPLLLILVTALAALALTRPVHECAVAVIVLAAGAVLTRYDAVLFAGPVAATALMQQARDRRVLLAALAALLVGGAWLAFCAAYYEDLLPTSFYVKAGGAPGLSELARGVAYEASFFVLSGAWLLARRGAPRDVATALARAVWLGLALELAYATWAGTKHMMYAYRLFVPWLPVLALLLLRAPRPVSPTGWTWRVAALLALDACLGIVLYTYSENPNLSLLVRRQSMDTEVYEFSTIGARHTGAFLAAVRREAPAIVRDWSARAPSPARAPRILVSTGGTLPYALMDAYTLELLVSYRHACKAPLLPMADYEQVIYAERRSDEIARARDAQGGQVISREALLVDGLEPRPVRLLVETWYLGARTPVVLPPTVRGACR